MLYIKKRKDVCGFLLLILLGSFTGNAQEITPLKGLIKTTGSAENIHVINLNLKKGATTNARGAFEILAREKDTIFFSSVQYEKKKVVVTPEMLQNKNLVIELPQQMNELAEVMIDDIQLSGYLANDVAKISLKDYEMKSRLQMDLNTFIEKDRELNPYIDPDPGIRLDKLAAAVMDKIKKPEEPVIDASPKTLVSKSVEIVGSSYFEKNLDLEVNEIYNFLYFCTEDIRFSHLVLEEKAFALIEYFQGRIDEFRNRRGELLNQNRQQPG